MKGQFKNSSLHVNEHLVWSKLKNKDSLQMTNYNKMIIIKNE